MALLRTVKKDLREGFAEGPFTAEELDARFGAGLWHPLWRFVILQLNKWRGIDDGHNSRHNEAQWAAVKVHTAAPAWVASVARIFHHRMPKLAKAAGILGIDLSLQGGTHDEKSAYRWKPVAEDDLRYSVVAYFDFEITAIRYVVLLGHSALHPQS